MGDLDSTKDMRGNIAYEALTIYKQAIKNIPLLKYSWILIATICILSLAAYFQLKNADVFFYSLLVLILSFFGFLFSYLLKTRDKFVRVLLYSLLSSIIITLCTAVLSFTSFIIFQQPTFYSKFFPSLVDKKEPAADSLGKTRLDSQSVIPSVSNTKGVWKPSANIIPRDPRIGLVQFELYGIESAYEKTTDFFAGVGPQQYTTYALDPYYDPAIRLNPVPIFNVVLENKSDKEIVLTKILYRISKVDQVKGGNYGYLEPAGKYEHILNWKTGDQEFSLMPPFLIAAHSHGSFLLQLKTDQQDIGLCWLLKVHFLTNTGSVSTDVFQLIMTGPY